VVVSYTRRVSAPALLDPCSTSSIERRSPLIWIDMEMSGLDPASCHILEIATVISDNELNVLAQGDSIIVHQPDEVLTTMNEWCIEHHAKSGLTDLVRASTVSLAEAEQRVLALVEQHTERGQSPLCGNSIDADRRFIARHMPRLAAHLQDRLIDVTSVKELARRWFPGLGPPPKQDRHRALGDILESIEELRFYRSRLFLPSLSTEPQP